MYFMHGNITNNVDAENTVKNLKVIIDAVIEDNDISYGDITILSSNINNNAVFDKLAILLKKNNIPSIFFKTKTQDGNVTIDLNKAKEQNC